MFEEIMFTDRQKQLGTVLQHAHNLLEQDPQTKFGSALTRAQKMLNVENVTTAEEAGMLMVLMQLVTKGFPSKIDA